MRRSASPSTLARRRNGASSSHLSRYAGLRCPSEHLGLTWADILWDRNRFVVRSPKTENSGKAPAASSRIFPALYPLPPGRIRGCGTRTGSRHRQEPRGRGMGNGLTTNWRTQFLRILRRAGLKTWPRLFHALRASCQTDLADQFPAHVVCEWLGNSLAVAREHYLQTIEAHYRKAGAEIRRALELAPITCAHRNGRNGTGADNADRNA